MGQSTPIPTNDEVDAAAQGLAWARLAGLVEIRADGSWNLTPQGFAGMTQVRGHAHPYDAFPARHDCRPHLYLV